MSNKKSLILSLILVLIVGLSIVAGTFAYFQWQAATGTSVNVTIEMGGIKMHIEPEATGFVGLYPTVHCLNNVRYGDTLVRIENNTGALAIPSFKLKVAIDPSVDNTGKLDDYKEHIHYAVVALETTKTGAKKMVDGEVVTVGGNAIDNLVTGTCAAPLNVSNTGDIDNTFKSDYGASATGLFNVITAEDTFADTPFLPREYNSTTGGVQGVTFRGEAYSTSYQWYRVYVWMDEGYTTTIVGDTVSDPLQNATFKVTWSENSMLQQVSGVSNVETGPEAGLYSTGGSFTSWDDLVTNGDITVNDTGITITDSSDELTGELVIQEGITLLDIQSFQQTTLTSVVIPSSLTIIDNSAFERSSISSVTFAQNSQLIEIGDSAFAGAKSLKEIKLPKSLTLIDQFAFRECTSLDTIKFEGTIEEWNAINKRDEWNSSVPATYVECSDGSSPLLEAGLYSENVVLTKTWQELLNDNDITVENNVITDSNESLTEKLVISEDITEIGNSAFYGTSITSIAIPATVTNIRTWAFYYIPLESIIFEKDSQLTSIGTRAFAGTDITSIAIPATVTSIDEGAFENCMDLSEITFEGTVSEWNAITKGYNWNSGVPATKVICSDGEVSL